MHVLDIALVIVENVTQPIQQANMKLCSILYNIV